MVSSDETVKTSVILDAFLPPKHPSMKPSIVSPGILRLHHRKCVRSWLVLEFLRGGQVLARTLALRCPTVHGARQRPLYWALAVLECHCASDQWCIFSVLSKWKLFSSSAHKGVGNWILCHISVYKIGLQGRQLAKYHLGHAVLPGFVTYCITRPNIILNLDYKIIFLYDLFYIHILYQLYILNYLIM